MRAILKEKPGYGFSFKRVDVPKVGHNEVLVKVKYVSICGSDLHIYRWDESMRSRIKPPRIIGHEFAGEVVEIGEGVENIEVGDYVSAETHIYCGKCYQCRIGKPHICRNLKILGVDVDGAYADYVVVPANIIWKNDPIIPPEFASVQEPFGNAVHASFTVDLSMKKVLITGLGPIGLMSAMIAQAIGSAIVIGTEVNPYRIRLAESAGIEHVVNPLEEDLTKKVMKLTDGTGVDVVLEMSGNPSALKQGLELLTNGGDIVLLGIFDGEVNLKLNELVIFKGVKIHGVTGRLIFETWELATRLLKSGKVDLSKVITHILPFEEWEKGMELMDRGECGKVVLKL